MKPTLVKRGGTVEAPAATLGPRPLVFGGLALGADGLTVTGRPEFGDYQQAMEWTVYLEEKSPFWKGDLLNYGYSREDWAGLIDALASNWGLTLETLDNYRSVCKRVPAHARVDGLTFSHHEAVAALATPDQRYYLAQAKRDCLRVLPLKRIIRQERTTTKILAGQSGTLAKAHAAIVLAALDAQTACKAIPVQDAAHAEQRISEARNALDQAEEAVGALRQIQGRQKIHIDVRKS